MPSADSSWRAVRIRGIDRFTLRIVPRDRPFSEGIERETHDGIPAWVDDDELCHCTRDGCRRIDVASGEERTTIPVAGPDADTTWMAPTSACDRWFTTRSDARVTRKKIVNFASRPWAP
jgi:hypothetical protein